MEQPTRQFVQSLNNLGRFSAEEAQRLFDCLDSVLIPKGTSWLTIGQVCQNLGFLESGALVHYRMVEDGNPQVLNLGLPGDWMLDHQSFTQQQPSKFQLEAAVDSQLFTLSIEQLHHLIGFSPSFFQLGKILDSTSEFSHQSLVNLSPLQRYHKLLKLKPQLLQAYPLKTIAAYLGITPETLSRVRKRVQKELS